MPRKKHNQKSKVMVKKKILKLIFKQLHEHSLTFYQGINSTDFVVMKKNPNKLILLNFYSPPFHRGGE
jgi:hypothetical protein